MDKWWWYRSPLHSYVLGGHSMCFNLFSCHGFNFIIIRTFYRYSLTQHCLSWWSIKWCASLLWLKHLLIGHGSCMGKIRTLITMFTHDELVCSCSSYASQCRQPTIWLWCIHDVPNILNACAKWYIYVHIPSFHSAFFSCAYNWRVLIIWSACLLA